MSTANESATPAGWYRDPLGLPQLRWWNGVQWTNRVEEPPARLPQQSESSRTGRRAARA